MNEFDIITKYFTTQTDQRADVTLGIGDDAAIVKIPPEQELVITTDTLVAGVHFQIETSPNDIGYKALAVNLSDLAAMGAMPAWFTLALTLPTHDATWLQEFCAGLFTLAHQHQVQLIGGDLTRGPLSITIQAMGYAPSAQTLLRSGAKPGDLIYVTGTLGDAGLGLRVLQDKLTLNAADQRLMLQRLNRPEPRIATGLCLRGHASAAIDISDGLAADLNHILAQSQVGAEVQVDALPLSTALTRTLSLTDAIHLALTAGDDYELCFTVSPKQRSILLQHLAAGACHFTCIGKIIAQPGLLLRYKDGNNYHGATLGYQHF